MGALATLRMIEIGATGDIPWDRVVLVPISMLDCGGKDGLS